MNFTKNSTGRTKANKFNVKIVQLKRTRAHFMLSLVFFVAGQMQSHRNTRWLVDSGSIFTCTPPNELRMITEWKLIWIQLNSNKNLEEVRSCLGLKNSFGFVSINSSLCFTDKLSSSSDKCFYCSSDEAHDTSATQYLSWLMSKVSFIWVLFNSPKQRFTSQLDVDLLLERDQTHAFESTR